MRRSSFGVLFAIALPGCSASTITDDLTQFGGDYTLRSVSGFCAERFGHGFSL